MSNQVVLYSSGLKLSSKSPETIKETKLELSRIARSIFGISNNISNQIIDELTEFIIGHYSDFTPKEIRYAFELYASGKLDIPDKFYGSLSAMLISSVLSAYREHRSYAIRLSKSVNNSKKEERLLPEASPESKDKSMHDTLIRTMLDMKEVPFAWDWESVHRHLMEIMADVKPYLEFSDIAAKMLSSEASSRRERNAFDKFIYSDVDIIGLSKKLAIQEYLKRTYLDNGEHHNHQEEGPSGQN